MKRKRAAGGFVRLPVTKDKSILSATVRADLLNAGSGIERKTILDVKRKKKCEARMIRTGVLSGGFGR